MAAFSGRTAVAGVLCAILLHLLPPAVSGSTINGNVYCDTCLDGMYNEKDIPATYSPITVNCTISSGAIFKTTKYVLATGGTDGDGNFRLSLKSGSGASNSASAESVFKNTLFVSGNPSLGTLPNARVEACSVKVDCDDCPIAIMNDGQCNAGGKLGNGYTGNVQLANIGSTGADIVINNRICYAPRERDEDCPAEAPPPPGGEGDPHYTGADGSHFDFSGEPNATFCLVSDSHLHINAFYAGRYGRWGDNPHKALTWIRQIGILWGHHTIVLAVREGARWQYDTGYMARIAIDGEEVRLGQAGDFTQRANGDIEVRWVAAKLQSGDDLIDVYQITIGEVLKLRLKLRPEIAMLRTDTDGLVHLDFEVPVADLSDGAHGVLGQTFRSDHRDRLAKQTLEYSELLRTDVVPGDNAEGFLDGSVADYKSSSLLRADCKYARFARAAARDAETAQAFELTSPSVTSMLNEGPRSIGVNRRRRRFA